jgi:hypothetical protein
LDTNILIKRRIYPLIGSTYKDSTPKLSSVENYLRIHWGFVALKHKKIYEGLQLMVPAVLSTEAWQIFLERTASRKGKRNKNLVRKITLQDKP